jgi:mRNA interferase MazF
MLDLWVVVPITAWQTPFAGFPWMVRLEPTAQHGLSKTSAADAFQVKSISTQRLLKRLGSLSEDEIAAIVEAVGLVIEHP